MTARRLPVVIAAAGITAGALSLLWLSPVLAVGAAVVGLFAVGTLSAALMPERPYPALEPVGGSPVFDAESRPAVPVAPTTRAA